MLIVAGIINSIGITMFLSPVNLYDSGISGTSMFLDLITPEKFSLSLFLLVLNIPLFLFGYKKQGVLFTAYAVFTVGMYSLSAWIITDVLPVDVSVSSPLAGTVFFFVPFSAVLYQVWAAALPYVTAERWTALKLWRLFFQSALA